VWLPNWTEAVVWEFALAAVGAANLGINTRYSVHELTHLLERGRPVGVVMPERFLRLELVQTLHAAVAEARGSVPGFRPPWVAVARGGEAPSDRFDVGGGVWLAAEPDSPAGEADAELRDLARPDDLVNYFTTSGSTGMPKLAGHDQGSIATHCESVVRALEMAGGDCFLAVLPLSGVFGFNPAMAMLSAGGTCLLEPVFEPGQVLADMAEFDVTHVVGGDDMLGRLMDAWSENPIGLPQLRRGGIADFVGRSTAVAQWAETEFGARISGVYGSSELFSLTSIWPPELPLVERILGGGRLVSDQIEVRAVDPQSEEPCPVGTTGELQFRGYNVVKSYLGADASRSAVTEDGWFRSGDLGRLTESPGAFLYECRAGDALRLRGFLVQPSELEQFLMSHPKVSVAKVVGVSSEAQAEVAVAYVTLTAGESCESQELLDFCRERLAPFKVPSILNIIDEFPVTTGTNGTKIRTAELRRRAADQVAAVNRGGGR
jgi:fatty-acyl-CoA synthase